MDETYRFLTCGSYVSNLIVRTPPARARTCTRSAVSREPQQRDVETPPPLRFPTPPTAPDPQPRDPLRMIMERPPGCHIGNTQLQ